MLKRIAAVLVVLVALVGATFQAAPARAQETIKYGDVVTGELNDQQTEVQYTFTGQPNDLIVVQAVQLLDNDGKNVDLKVTLSDSEGQVLVDKDESYRKILIGVYAQSFFEILPAAGDYVITVTRTDETKSGTFELQLFQPETLEFGQEMSLATKVRGFSRFLAVYQVPADKPLSLTFTEVDGSEGMSISVKEYANDFIRDAASVSGVKASAVTVSLRPGDSPFYLVTIGSPSYVFSETTLKYSVMANAAE